jgi:hypothetical protein
MNRGALLDPLFIGSSKRHPMKKEATLKTQRGLSKRPPIKNRQPQKHKGAYQKDL